MELGIFRGILTAVLLCAFVGLWIWAWSGKRRGEFEQAAALPLEADDAPVPGVKTGEPGK